MIFSDLRLISFCDILCLKTKQTHLKVSSVVRFSFDNYCLKIIRQYRKS